MCYPDGSKADNASQDAVIGKTVTGPLHESSAKLVDLDPQFQFSSQIWGLKLCIYGSENEVLLSGYVEPSGFKDLQIRNFPPIQNGQPLGASWTSVIHNLEWGKNARESKILSALMDRSAKTGLLACNLASFGYYKIIGGERFTLGRLLGAIGPYTEGDPHQFAPARRLIGLDIDYALANKLEVPKEMVPRFAFSNSFYDENQARLSIDLGGSFPLAHPLGIPKDVGNLYIGVAKDPNLREQLPNVKTPEYYFIEKDKLVKIGKIDYNEDWILNSSGIADFTVMGEAKTLIENRQIVLFADTDSDLYKVLACETRNGLSVRADDNIKRVDTKLDGSVDFGFTIRAYQWGKKLAGGEITFKRYSAAEFADDPDSCKQPEVPSGIDPHTGQVIQPCTNWPAESILINGEENVKVITDDHGEATVAVSVFHPGNPRGYIDGQIFLISYMLEGLPPEQQYNLSFMGMWLMDGLIMHVRNAYEEIKKPVWRDIAEIMTQYSNLYPLMSKNILDLSDPKAVAARKKIMLYAFTRGMHDPTYMPVSRDLSEGKRKTIVNWLNTDMEELDEDATMPASMLKASAPPLPAERQKNKPQA